MNEDDDDKIRNSTLKIFFGCLILAICILLLKDGFPFSIDKYRLIFSTQRLFAQVHEASEIPPDCHEGHCWSGWYVEYLYRLPDTSTVLDGSSQLSGAMPDRFAEESLPQEIEIEYVPSHPYLSKVVGSGQTSFWRVFVGDLMSLILILSVLFVGGFLVLSGGKTIWNYPLNPLGLVFGTIANWCFGIGTLVFVVVASFSISWLIRSVFRIPESWEYGLPGIVFFPLFFLSVYTKLKIEEFVEARNVQSSKSRDSD